MTLLTDSLVVRVTGFAGFSGWCNFVSHPTASAQPSVSAAVQRISDCTGYSLTEVRQIHHGEVAAAGSYTFSFGHGDDLVVDAAGARYPQARDQLEHVASHLLAAAAGA